MVWICGKNDYLPSPLYIRGASICSLPDIPIVITFAVGNNSGLILMDMNNFFFSSRHLPEMRGRTPIISAFLFSVHYPSILEDSHPSFSLLIISTIVPWEIHRFRRRIHRCLCTFPLPFPQGFQHAFARFAIRKRYGSGYVNGLLCMKQPRAKSDSRNPR